MPTPVGTPVVLHLDIGGEFIIAMLNRYGVKGWNLWLDAVCACVPGYWSEGEDEPPLCFRFDLAGVDLSGRNLDGIELVLVWCKGTRFDDSSLVGARMGCCKHASFRGCDLRDTHFVGDISGVDFTGAVLDGIHLEGASFDPADLPIGLPNELLCLCHQEADNEGTECGLVERPVSIKASLIDSHSTQ